VIVDALRQVVGTDHVLVGDDLTAGYTTDWTGRYRGRTAAVVRSGTTDEVRRVVELCAAHGVALVPQGGNTGLVGGSVPHGGELVLSLRRLRWLGDVDVVAGTVAVGAGVTLGELQSHVAGSGWSIGLDTTSRDTATLGGLVATNAGGSRVLRYGDMRAQVIGVQAVLGTGDVIDSLGRPAKDNTGYHLPSLLCGSEGTLAVVTAVEVRLHPTPAARATALLAFADVSAALRMIPVLRHVVPDLEAVELMVADGVRLVCDTEGLAKPFTPLPGAMLLVECAGAVGADNRLLAALPSLAESVVDALVATDDADRRGLWAYRERHTESIARHGVALKLDVTLALHRLAEFCDAARNAVGRVRGSARVLLFGHAADGNVHVNILGVTDIAEEVTDVVLRLVAERGGSISSEHGIGIAKRRWVPLTRPPAELAAFGLLKQALDPHGILNPGVLVDPCGTAESDAR
jgi:FAD/FMN-containing dehydrogenase